jgi:aspartate/methionine/tyrosine aminotransferase
MHISSRSTADVASKPLNQRQLQRDALDEVSFLDTFGAGATDDPNVAFASNNFPIEDRNPNFRSLDEGTVFSSVLEKARSRMHELTPYRVLEIAQEDRCFVTTMILTRLAQQLELAGSMDKLLSRIKAPQHDRDRLIARLCGGLPEKDPAALREWLAESILRPSGLPLPEQADQLANQVAICGSSSMHIHNAVAASVLRAGETVLVPEGSFCAFYSVGYVQGAEVRVISTAQDGLKLTAARLALALSRLDAAHPARLLLLTNPTNPTGYSYTAQELRDIATVCLRNNVLLLVDELYSNFEIDPQRRPDVHAAGLRLTIDGSERLLHDHIVTTWGCSKLYDLYQPKLGLAMSGNTDLIAEVNRQLHLDRHHLSLREATEAKSRLECHHPQLDPDNRVLRERYQTLKAAFEKASAICDNALLLLQDPHAGYFATVGIPPKVAEKLGIRTHLQFAQLLHERLGVLSNPTTTMMIDPSNFLCTRINFGAASPETITSFFDGLGKVICEARDSSSRRVGWRKYL